MTTATKLTLDDVHAGDALPELAYDVTATTVVLGALASRDTRPMHHDHDFAVNRNGTQDIFLNTPNQAAWFERFLTDWSGPKGRLGRMKFRMKGSVFPGDTMVLAGTVENVETDDDRLRLGDGARAPHRRRRPQDRLHRAHRAARPTTTTTPGPAAATSGAHDERQEYELMDLDLTRRAGDAAGDGARRVQLVRVARDGARARRRPGRLSRPSSGSRWPSSTSSGSWSRRSTAAPSMSAARGRGRLHGARARARAVAALRERGDGRGRVAAGGHRRAEAGVAAAHRRRRRDPHDRVARAAATASAPRACRRRATADGDEFVLDGVKWHVPFASAATAIVVLARTGDGDDDVDLFLVDPAAAGVTMEQQLTIASDTQYEVDARGVRVPASARIGARRFGLGDVARHDARRDRAARGAGGRRRALRARHHRAVRQGPRAVRQAARRVPGDRALPRRRGDRGRRRARRSCTKRRGRARTAADRPARADGEAVRVQDVPRRHRDGAAGVRRRRLHASSTTSSSTSAGPSSSRSRGGTTACSKS